MCPHQLARPQTGVLPPPPACSYLVSSCRCCSWRPSLCSWWCWSGVVASGGRRAAPSRSAGRRPARRWGRWQRKRRAAGPTPSGARQLWTARPRWGHGRGEDTAAGMTRPRGGHGQGEDMAYPQFIISTWSPSQCMVSCVCALSSASTPYHTIVHMLRNEYFHCGRLGLPCDLECISKTEFSQFTVLFMALFHEYDYWVRIVTTRRRGTDLVAREFAGIWWWMPATLLWF